MPKPQPWYASLNQPPRSHAHGRNRKPNPSTHRRAADRTNTAVDPGTNDTTAFWTNWSWRALAFPELPAPPTIPYAGVRAGEIIGHRLWYVCPGLELCSIAHYQIWQPDETISGDLNEEVGNASWIHPIWGGVYSFRTADQCWAEIAGYGFLTFPTVAHFTSLRSLRFTHIDAIAIGTIKCWGEVIEHERGWRAQFAKLHTIDSVIGITNIEALRERYLPNGQ